MSLNTGTNVNRVIYRDNSIVIYYKNPMMRLEVYSCLVPGNYAIIDTDNNKIPRNLFLFDPTNIKVEELIRNYTVKFTLFSNLKIFHSKCYLSIGYVYLNCIPYIINLEQLANNFCIKFILGNPATDIDLSQGLATKLDNSTLIYSCAPNNGFYPKISVNDFYVSTDTKTIIPKNVIYDYTSGNTITLVFDENSLPSTGTLTLNTIANPKTTDAFLYPILGNKSIVFQEPDTIILQPGELIPHSLTPINKNFIIYISKNNSNRSYGYNDITVEINGWIKVLELPNLSLDIPESVDFTNLIINNNATIYLHNGQLVLNNITSNTVQMIRN